MSLFELSFCPFLEKFFGPFRRTKASSRAEWVSPSCFKSSKAHLIFLIIVNQISAWKVFVKHISEYSV